MENLRINSFDNYLKAERLNELWRIMEFGFYENLHIQNPIRINLGIDLGTSCSKVVWRLRESAFPLCFGDNPQNLTDYLVPSIVSFKNDDILSGLDFINKDFQEELFLSNFKMCLICEHQVNSSCNINKCSLTKWDVSLFKTKLFETESEIKEVDFANTFYLAKLIAKAKQLISEELIKKGFKQPLDIKWTANLSVPEEFLIEETSVSKAFDDVFKTAFLMSEVFVGIPKLENRETIFDCYLTAKDLMHNLTNNLQKEHIDFDCFSYSEVGAQVTSILLSKTSEDGLYAFVDIGAGTVDASVFRFWHSDSEPKRPPYTAKVFKEGASQIEMLASKNSSFSVQKLKQIKETLNALTDYEKQEISSEIESLNIASNEIELKYRRILKQVFREAYDNEPNIESWKNLKLILSGGGSNLKCFKEAAIHAFSLYNQHQTIEPNTLTLPIPNDFQLKGILENDFHRFAVAYGLSHEIINLPQTEGLVMPISMMSQRESRNNNWYEK